MTARRPRADRGDDAWAALGALRPPADTVATVAAACAADDPAAAEAAVAAHPGASADVLVDLGTRARVLVRAVRAAGAEPTFLDGAGRLVPGAPGALGPVIGRVLRRRRPQTAAAWREAAVECAATPGQLAAVLGVLIETLIDDLAAAADRPRADIATMVWPPPNG